MFMPAFPALRRPDRAQTRTISTPSGDHASGRCRDRGLSHLDFFSVVTGASCEDDQRLRAISSRGLPPGEDGGSLSHPNAIPLFRPGATVRPRPSHPAQRRSAPAGGGAGADRGLWPPAGGRRRCGVAKAIALSMGRGAGGIAGHHLPPRLRAGSGNAQRFPRPCATVRQRPSHPAQRRPAPAGGGRALAGGFGPRLAKGQRGALAGAMAPARETGLPGTHRNAPPGGNRKRTAFPPPARDGAL
jgi:hypothetical protein